MKKKILIILLVSVLLIPSTVVANEQYTCDGDKYDQEKETYHMRKSDPKMDIIKTEYNLLGFYDEDKYELGGHQVENVTAGVCKIFCREDADYYFYGPKEVLAGRYFQYDIKGKVTTNSLLTAQIIGTKQCTSVIDYNKWKMAYSIAQELVVNKWSDLKKWESFFESDPDKNLTKDNVRDDLPFKKTLTGSCSNTGITCKDSEKTGNSVEYYYYVFEGKNALSFTFYGGQNVNNQGAHSNSEYYEEKLEDSTSCDGGGNAICYCTPCQAKLLYSITETDRDNKKKEIINNYESAKAAYIKALSVRESVILTLYNCNLYNTISEGNDYRTTSNLGLGSSQGTYDFPVDDKLVKNTISNQYPNVFGHCDENKNDCNINYGDDEHHDKEYGSTPKLGIDKVSTSTTSTSYCSNLNYTPETQSGPCLQDAISSGNTTDDYVSYISCYGQFTGATCDSKSIKLKLPINSMATFKTSVVYDMWQEETYSVYSYTGVSQNPGVEIPGVSIMLDPRTYPVSLLTPSGQYKVALSYNKGFDKNIKRPDRTDIKILTDSGLVPEEDAAKFLSSNKPKQNKNNDIYTCYILVDNETTLMDCDDDCCLTDTCDTPETCKKDKNGACISDGSNGLGDSIYELGFVFRTVNLENIFPSSRKRGKNWTTEFANKVIESSKEKASTIWSSKPEYSYVLSATNRQNIRDYNRKMENQNGNFEGVTDKVTFISSGYLSNDLTCGVEGKEFVNCKSGFLAMNNALTGPEQFFTGGKVE